MTTAIEQPVSAHPVPPAPSRPPFLDVPTLLEASVPRPQAPRGWYLLAGFLGVTIASAIVGARAPQMRTLVEVTSVVLLLGLMGGLSAMTLTVVRRFRAEQQQVDTAGELVQLRRWPEAAVILEQYLSRPARNGQLRASALVYLSSVLSRYHRFEDAIAVQEHLLDHGLVDPMTGYALRLGRAMAMLREDHLYDADRAISELRRLSPNGRDSAGLALVEIYRDVKTGHPTEAVETFAARLPALRDQLGHRLADAYALAARAYDLLGRVPEAQAAWVNATRLAPSGELFRRYPEVQKLQDRYSPAPAPPEAA